MSPRAFVFGMALFPVRIKSLAILVTCVNLIAAASLSPRSSAVALKLVLVVFPITLLALIGLYATVPQRASSMLGSLRMWMEKNSRAITVVLCFMFGASAPEATGYREIMSSRRSPVMDALTRGILKSVDMVTLLMTACLPVLSPHECGKRATRETSLSNSLGSGRLHVPGATCG